MAKKKEHTPFWKGFGEEIKNLKEIEMAKYLIRWMIEVSSIPMVILIMVLTAGRPLFQLLWPFCIKLAVDALNNNTDAVPAWIQFLSNRSSLSLWFVCLLLAGLSHFAGKSVFDFATLLARIVSYNVEKLLKDKLYFRVVFASLGIHDSFEKGDLITTLTRAPTDVRIFLYSKGFSDAFPLVVRNIMICVNFALIDWVLFGMAPPFLLIGFLIYIIGARSINRNEMAIWKAEKKVMAYLSDIVVNIAIIKTFLKERVELNAIEKENVLQLEANKQQAKNWRVLTRVTDFWNLILWVAVSLYIGSGIASGKHTVGTIIQVSALYLLFVDSFFQSGIMYSTFRALVIKLKDVVKILDSEPEDLDNPNKIVLPEIKHGITIRNLEFAYDVSEEEGGKREVLKGVNCEILVGQTTLIAGMNGSGKSTLFKILLGFYQQQHGDVLYDHYRSKELTLRSIRSQFSMVDQQAWLKPGTIFDNIAYGLQDEATPEQVEAAAITAGIHDHIMTLPLEYRTDVGEWAKKISGGQRQRIAIARALISNTPIVFFDEPLASIDAPNRIRVWADIRERLKDKTIIVVSHIPLSVNHVIILKDGVVVETGTEMEMDQSEEFQNLFYPDRQKAA